MVFGGYTDIPSLLGPNIILKSISHPMIGVTSLSNSAIYWAKLGL
jgi:hypothetical protein